jgi:glutathione gamma-glutamylcysteinyltransferase
VFDFEIFESIVKTVTKRQDIYILVNYYRKTLNQTGEGHYSPLGGFCEQEKKGFIQSV